MYNLKKKKKFVKIYKENNAKITFFI
jgi:hypothetical protein